MGNLMVPIKKFLSNKNTITILGVLIGVVVLYVGYNWRVTKSIQPVEVPISAVTMIAGTEITEENVNFTEIPKETIANMENILTTTEDIVGKLVSFDSKIPQNGFFFSENVIERDEMPDSLFSNIQDGYTIVSFDVNNKTTYGNAIFPGDTIDIYLGTNTEDGLLVFSRFIASIQVLAVRDGDGNDVFRDRDNPTEPAVMSFAVPEYLYLLLMKAQMTGFQFQLVARNDSYSENAQPTRLISEELEEMILNKTYIVHGECHDLTVCG
jgi:Flp pilus assembly protein CpaB